MDFLITIIVNVIAIIIIRDYLVKTYRYEALKGNKQEADESQAIPKEEKILTPMRKREHILGAITTVVMSFSNNIINWFGGYSEAFDYLGELGVLAKNEIKLFSLIGPILFFVNCAVFIVSLVHDELGDLIKINNKEK